MFKRIEELEDLLVEMKQKSGVAKIVELETQLTQANIEIGRKTQIIDELSTKLREAGGKEVVLWDANDQARVMTGKTPGPSIGAEEWAQLRELIERPSDMIDDHGRKVKVENLYKQDEMRHT